MQKESTRISNESFSTQFSIEGMSCVGCAKPIQKALKSTEGVFEAEIYYPSQKVALSFDPKKTSLSSLKQKIETLGYSIVSKEEPKEMQKTSKYTILQKLQSNSGRLIFSIVLSLPILVLSMFSGLIPILSSLGWSLKGSILLILTTPIQFFVGFPLLRSAWKGLQYRSFTMDTLVALGTLSAYLYSAFAVLFLSSAEYSLYFESSALVITFVILGRAIEDKIRNKGSESIQKLMALQPKTAQVLIQNEDQNKDPGKLETLETKEIPIESLHIGDSVLVRAGEQIPSDGTVLYGESLVDESMFTGEPLAVQKKSGKTVWGGSLNQSGFLVLKIEKLGENTLLSEMLSLIESAENSKVPIQRIADKVVGYFVPVILALAVLTFLSWWILLELGMIASRWESIPLLVQALIPTVAVLVIACPCAIGLAVPTAMAVALGKGAKIGILIRDPESLENIEKINFLVTDKTGTLTEGKPQVSDIISFSDHSNNSDNARENNKEREDREKDEILRLSANLEKKVQHPLGLAIIKSAEERKLSNIPMEQIQDFKVIEGRGVSANYQNQSLLEPILLGSQKLMEEHQIQVQNIDSIRKLKEQGKSLVYLAKNSKILACIAISDPIKNSAKQTIQDLKKLGIEILMLTGDHFDSAQKVAKELGIQKFQSDCLPKDKIQIIETLQKDQKVAMLGDGINDAPALSQSDLGIALGSGADIAIQASTIVLVQNDLRSVYRSFILGKQTLRTIRINLFWAWFYNLIALPFAAFGLLNPMIAGLAMALSSISVVSHSFLLKFLPLEK